MTIRYRFPIDTATGLPCGGPVYYDNGAAAVDGVETIVGWLVTLPDGQQSRLGPDRAAADDYAARHRAVSLEPMRVRRSGSAI